MFCFEITGIPRCSGGKVNENKNQNKVQRVLEKFTL